MFVSLNNRQESMKTLCKVGEQKRYLWNQLIDPGRLWKALIFSIKLNI